MSLLIRIERLFIVTGLALIAAYGLIEVHRLAASRAALLRFRALQHAAIATENKQTNNRRKTDSEVDFSLWSEARIQAYFDTLENYSAPPVALLRIDRLQIDVPVFDGTDDPTLNRGAGRIVGSGRPGEGGNIGISGHRDGFFRALKDVRMGDSVVLELASGKTETYVVDQIQVVDPENVDVLKPRAAPSVTLVTCYPFYFIGSAPKRFIVQGSLQK